jgi:hypothetical protein
MITYSQDLVNAQVSVNRAVWAMNEQFHLNRKSESNIDDQYILIEVKKAIQDLISVTEILEKK